MSAEYLVVGHFSYADDTLSAIQKVKARGHADYELYSPVPNHELEDEIYADRPRSPVRRFTLLGGLTGCLGAFLMTCWMSMDWPLRTSAKTIISIPAFIVVAFECTILLGAICTLIGMLHHSRVPHLFATPGFRPDFSKDTFGLIVRVSKDEAETLKQELSETGAKEVEIQYVR